MIGQLGLGIGAAAGVAGLCVYGLGLGSEAGAIDKYGCVQSSSSMSSCVVTGEPRLWPSYVRERLHSTYAYLGSSLVLTAGAGVAASRSPTILRLASANSLVVALSCPPLSSNGKDDGKCV